MKSFFARMKSFFGQKIYLLIKKPSIFNVPCCLIDVSCRNVLIVFFIPAYCGLVQSDHFCEVNVAETLQKRSAENEIPGEGKEEKKGGRKILNFEKMSPHC